MPKLGMEPIRREALVKATIAEIGAAGSLDVTVSQIARRAGMSSALAHHYFGGKVQIFLAAMRHILTEYGGEVRAALAKAPPDRRLEALIAAGHPGMAVPSFARGARHNSLNIILWEWGPNSAAQLRLVDDETRLGGGPSRATGGGDNPP